MGRWTACTLKAHGWLAKFLSNQSLSRCAVLCWMLTLTYFLLAGIRACWLPMGACKHGQIWLSNAIANSSRQVLHRLLLGIDFNANLYIQDLSRWPQRTHIIEQQSNFPSVGHFAHPMIIGNLRCCAACIRRAALPVQILYVPMYRPARLAPGCHTMVWAASSLLRTQQGPMQPILRSKAVMVVFQSALKPSESLLGKGEPCLKAWCGAPMPQVSLS